MDRRHAARDDGEEEDKELAALVVSAIGGNSFIAYEHLQATNICTIYDKP